MNSFTEKALLLLALSIGTLSVPTGQKGLPRQQHCTNFNVPVTVDTQHYLPTIKPFTNQYEATEFILESTGRTPIKPPVIGPFPFKKQFNINVEYCPVPGKGNHSYDGEPATLLLLTHGIGFDKSYWSFLSPEDNSPNNYSFTYNANQAGYSTLSYDRLGFGQSTHADPYTEVQSPVELAILGELTALAKLGGLSCHGVQRPKKVVNIGHSFGSQLGTGLAATPKLAALSDGIVNTGYSLNGSFRPFLSRNSAYHIAALNQPGRMANRNYGYLTWADAVDNQYDFLAWPYFDPAVLEKAERTKQPFAWAEMETAVPAMAPEWEKPTFIMAASNDLVFCGSNCTLDFITPGAQKAFPAAKPLDIYVQPHTGHGMNLHYNATGWYNIVFNWLDNQGF